MSITSLIVILNTTMLLANASVNAISSLLIMKELKKREK
ncbi:DNA-binding ATPase [Bacillus phage vB_BceH_LY2]|nr:DNA-binding ATPase [Bacillus phage vB_BceH_LY2]